MKTQFFARQSDALRRDLIRTSLATCLQYANSQIELTIPFTNFNCAYTDNTPTVRVYCISLSTCTLNDALRIYIRWKLPTETLGVSEEIKWLFLTSNSSIILCSVVIVYGMS